MAQTSYARNLFGSIKFGDLSLVLIKIQDTALVAADSSPDVTVTSAGSGVYNITFPKATFGFVVGTEQVANGATTTEVISFSATAGTMSIDTGSDLSGGDQVHVAILLGAA